MTGNPIDRIEQGHGNMDLGRFAVQVFRGALEEADGDMTLAGRACAAYWAGIFRGGGTEQPRPDEETS